MLALDARELNAARCAAAAAAAGEPAAAACSGYTIFKFFLRGQIRFITGSLSTVDNRGGHIACRARSVVQKSGARTNSS